MRQIVDENAATKQKNIVINDAIKYLIINSKPKRSLVCFGVYLVSRQTFCACR